MIKYLYFVTAVGGILWWRSMASKPADPTITPIVFAGAPQVTSPVLPAAMPPSSEPAPANANVAPVPLPSPAELPDAATPFPRAANTTSPRLPVPTVTAEPFPPEATLEQRREIMRRRVLESRQASAEAASRAAASARAALPAAAPTMLDQGNRPVGALSSAAANSSTQGLPWPVEGHTFTISELNQYRALIAGKIVWVKLSPTRVERGADGNEVRVFVRDGTRRGNSVEDYAYVSFPTAGAEKLKVMETTSRGVLSFYVKVESNRLTAVGRSKAIDSMHQTFSYIW